MNEFFPLAKDYGDAEGEGGGILKSLTLPDSTLALGQKSVIKCVSLHPNFPLETVRSYKGLEWMNK